MDFRQRRRQQFLTEARYSTEIKRLPEEIAYFSVNPVGSGSSKAQSEMLARQLSAENRYDLLSLRYTAGEPIEPLRAELEEVVAAYERYGEHLWRYQNDRGEPVFKFYSLDDYCQLMQIVGLCFLLYRRDLLERVAALQDGVDRQNGGADWLLEELLSYAPMKRHQSEILAAMDPYEALADAMCGEDNQQALDDLHRFLQRWYKDLAGTAWHDSHKPDDNGNQGGYYGYWSFEAGAAVLLLGIEDDSSLHQYMHYPKDMVAWARENASVAALSPISINEQDRLRCPAGQPCPQAGYWLTPAKMDSRRLFKQGEIMPDMDSNYGATIWQWDVNQG